MASATTTSPKTASSGEIEMFNRVHSRFPNSEPRNFFFFYRPASPFSNFHPAEFEEDGIQFTCNEQYMMYHKARLFGDHETAEKILKTSDPNKCKGLGRKAAGFDLDIWKENRSKIVSRGIYLKFTQNSQLKAQLLKHPDSLFVEAAANDRIWGVGLDEQNPLIRDRSNWKGLNLLGYILSDVRDRIIDEEKS